MADEQALFDALPENVREEWKVKAEDQTFTDTDQRRQIRFELLNVHDAKLLGFVETAKSVSSVEDFQALVEKTDFTGVSNSDISELLFAIGPSGVTAMLHGALKHVETDEDVAYVAELSQARHEMLSALQNFPS